MVKNRELISIRLLKDKSLLFLSAVRTGSLRFAIALILAAGATAPVSGSGWDPPESGQKYNVVLITINSFRYGHLGANGYDRNTTPAMDKLAETSFVFKNTFAQAGYTMPNMMTMFTSLYPESHNVMDAYKDVLSSEVLTIAEIMKARGYSTGGFWMTGVPHLDKGSGFGRGFDLLENLNRDFKGTDELLEWIRKNKDRPFFLALNTRTTHPPFFPLARYKQALLEGIQGDIITNSESFEKAVYEKWLHSIRTPGSLLHGIIDARRIENYGWLFDGEYTPMKLAQLRLLIPPQYVERHGELNMRAYFEKVDLDDPENIKFFRSLYDACLLSVDQELVKPILTLIRSLDIGDRTIIVISGDHGTGLGEHQVLGPGTLYYDEMIHVPLVISVPGLRKRTDIDAMVETVDLLPTILELLRIDPPPQVQGMSMVPLMKGGSGVEFKDTVYGNNRVYAYIRTPDWKLIAWRDQLDEPSSEKDELYHIRTDPQEKNNVYKAYPEKYQELRGKVRETLLNAPRYIDREFNYPVFIDNSTKKRIRETGYW